MSILSTREWATLIWGCVFMLYVLCHKETRKSFWNVIVIFFDVNVNIKMIKKWKIKMYIFQDLFLSLCFHKGSFFF